MEQENLHTPFSKAVLAGLFTGIVATVVSLAFNSIYRTATYFEPSAIINVSSIIFAVLLLLTVFGFVYHGLSNYRYGKMVYWIIIVLLFGGSLLLDAGIERTTDAHLNSEFRQLLSGIIIISGLSALFIPYLATHENNII